MALAAEGVGGKGHTFGVGGDGPGHVDARTPKGAQAVESALRCVARIIGRTKQGHDARNFALGCTVLAHQRRQGLAGADFDKYRIALNQLGLDRTTELNRGTHLAGPVLRVRGLGRLQRQAADA